MDYYKILGVSKDDSLENIKKVYRKLAKLHHPDANNEGGNEEKFKEIRDLIELEVKQLLKDLKVF